MILKFPQLFVTKQVHYLKSLYNALSIHSFGSSCPSSLNGVSMDIILSSTHKKILPTYTHEIPIKVIFLSA